MKISICIPAYNRAAYLPELLDSIIAQDKYSCDLQIVISDNASTDDTISVVKSYEDRFSDLVFYQSPENMGADRNFLKVVELADGDFCWLMGSDDKLEPGAIAAAEKAISNNPDIAGLSVRRNLYGFRMEQIPYPKLEDKNRPFDQETCIHGAERIFDLLGDYFGYLSGTLVNRALWNDVVDSFKVENYFNAWVHVFIIGEMIKKVPRWVYVPTGCVAWRMMNDHFLSSGMYKRLDIDVAGYSEITSDLFGKKSDVYRSVMATRMRHAKHRILHARAYTDEKDFTAKARDLINRHYAQFPGMWLKSVPALYTPRSILSLIGKTRRALKAKTVR